MSYELIPPKLSVVNMYSEVRATSAGVYYFPQPWCRDCRGIQPPQRPHCYPTLTDTSRFVSYLVPQILYLSNRQYLLMLSGYMFIIGFTIYNSATSLYSWIRASSTLLALCLNMVSYVAYSISILYLEQLQFYLMAVISITDYICTHNDM